VVANDAQGYEASGTVTGLWVEEGDGVERGQLLYAVNGGTVVAGLRHRFRRQRPAR